MMQVTQPPQGDPTNYIRARAIAMYEQMDAEPRTRVIEGLWPFPLRLLDGPPSQLAFNPDNHDEAPF